MGLPRTTHRWLQPLYDALDGRGTRQPQIGSSTGTIGLYGATGIAQIATGGAGILSATYMGASGFGATLIAASGVALSASGLAIFLARYGDNGGSGTPYTFGDVVCQLKNAGMLPR